MASTVSTVIKHAVGNKFQRRGTFNVGVYATGGVAVTASQLGLSVIESLQVGNFGGVLYEPTIAAGGASATIKCYWDNGTATAAALPQVANNTDLSAHVVTFDVMGH